MSDLSEISLGSEKMNVLKEELSKAIKFFQDMQTVSVPDAILEIGDEVEAATEALVPKLSKEILATWRKRASKIEKVNEALADFEYSTIQSLTASTAAVWFREVHKVVKKFEWIIGHIGELTLLLAASLGYVKGRYGDDFYNAIVGGLTAALDGDVAGVTKALGKVGSAGQEAVKFLVSSAILGIMAQVFSAAVAAFGAAEYARTIGPVLQHKRATEAVLQSQAFPQGKGRVRRLRHHRQR